MRCLEYMKVIEILRLYELGLDYRTIAQGIGCSKTTVGEIVAKCRECGLTYADAAEMTQERINELVYPESFGRKQVKEEPDFEAIHKRLQSNKRLNLQYIWTEEYRPANPEGYSYSQFCRKYSLWKEKTGKHVVFPQEREPGKELFIDWVGDTLDCVTDSSTGEIQTAHFFVTTLGESSYPFVEAFPDETQSSWIQGHVDAFEWYGGLPRILVPDNTKTAVIRSSLYDPDLNHAYRDLARHYGVGIIPARVRKPRDKPSVESGVGWLETWLIEWLKSRTYFSFEALNLDIKERVQELSCRKFQKREGSRQSIFDALDKPALMPLPKDRFEFFETKLIGKVPNNYHIEYKGFYYSVPYIYYNQPVVLHAYAKRVEIFLSGGERVAVHLRRYSGRRYVTEMEHMPENHKVVAMNSRYNGEYYRKRASYIGVSTHLFVEGLLAGVPVEEQAYRSCMAVINFSRKYGDERVEQACKKALALNSVNYTTLKNILKNNQEGQPLTKHSSDADTPTPDHENLRIGEWR